MRRQSLFDRLRIDKRSCRSFHLQTHAANAATGVHLEYRPRTSIQKMVRILFDCLESYNLNNRWQGIRQLRIACLHTWPLGRAGKHFSGAIGMEKFNACKATRQTIHGIPEATLFRTSIQQQKNISLNWNGSCIWFGYSKKSHLPTQSQLVSADRGTHACNPFSCKYTLFLHPLNKNPQL